VIEDGPTEVDPVTGEKKFYFYEVQDIQQLFNQAINTLFRLDANDEKLEVLNNLTAFINQLKDMMDEINAEMQQPAPAQTPVQPPLVAGPTGNLPASV
jgi:transcription initiation factor IIE alpha subunit